MKSNSISKIIIPIILVFTFIVAFIFGACATSTTGSVRAADKSSFDIIHQDSFYPALDIYTIKDSEYNVEYIVMTKTNGGVSITPRLKKSNIIGK